MQPGFTSVTHKVVVFVATIVSGSTLMLAALGPGLFPANAQTVTGARA